jgi:hypothetical protein
LLILLGSKGVKPGGYCSLVERVALCPMAVCLSLRMVFT